MREAPGRITVRVAGALVFGICLVVVLSAALSWFHTLKLEHGLETAVRERLEAEGFQGVEVAANGREILFTGTVEARLDRRRMVEIARSVPGVKRVSDRRTVTNYESGRPFSLQSYAGITTVEGELPDRQDIDLVLKAIRDSYGVDPLGADLAVRRAVRRPPWLDELAAILDTLGAVSPLGIEASDDALVVNGEVKDAATRDRITHRLEAIVGDIPLNVFLRLPAQLKEPRLRIQFKHGGLSISGTVPADDFSDNLLAALSVAFGTKNIETRLDKDPDVRHSSWLEGVLRVVFPLAMTNWFDLEVKPGEVVVQGSVDSDDELDIVSDQIRENFDYARRVVNLIRKQGGSG